MRVKMSRLGLLGDTVQDFLRCPTCSLVANALGERGPGKAGTSNLADHPFMVRRELGVGQFREVSSLSMRQAWQDPEYSEFTEEFLRYLVRLGEQARNLLAE